MPIVWNAPRAWAEAYEPEPHTVCVSITDTFAKPVHLKKGFLSVIRLYFHDVSEKYDNWGTWKAMTKEQARGLALFLNKWTEKKANILVHCEAGISRSGAVVEVILERWPEYVDRGKGRIPNAHVKALLKRELGMVPIGAN